MTESSVLDTGVLIGVSVENDTHHHDCIDYVIDKSKCYVTPTVDKEFQRKESEIRTTLSGEIADHRHAVSNEVEQDSISEDVISWIETNLLSRCENAYRCLKTYYADKKDEARIRRIDKLEIISDLEEMEMEVWEDAAERHGGLSELVTYWDDPIPSYRDVERELLICEGDDPVVCVESHHIATTGKSRHTELATTNPVHFVRQVDDEDETRKGNILRVTDLDDVIDLSWGGTV